MNRKKFYSLIQSSCIAATKIMIINLTGLKIELGSSLLLNLENIINRKKPYQLMLKCSLTFFFGKWSLF